MTPVTCALLIIFVQLTLLFTTALFLACCSRWNAVVRELLLKSAILMALATPLFTLGLHQSGIILYAIPVPATHVRNSGAPSVESTWRQARNLDQPADFTPLPEPVIETMAEKGQTRLPDHSASTPFRSWSLSLVVGVWSLGSVLLSARLLWSCARLNGILRSASAVKIDSSISPSIARVHPRIVCSAQARTPLTTGILRPTIVLPSRVHAELSADELQAVLLHETAHVARHDQLVLWLQHLVTVLYWPHPLIHFVNLALDRAREEVCDNHALAVMDRKSYGEALLRVATLVRPLCPASAVGLLSYR